MSDQQPRGQSRGGNIPPPPPPRTASSRSQSSAFPTIASLETTDQAPQSSRTSDQSTVQAPVFRVPASPRSTAAESSQTAGPKVAIPRLKRPIESTGDGSPRTGGRHRVNHACEPCRHRKTKCSGERPFCRHCQDFKIMCYYADGKRDRVKKQFGSMTEKVADYEKLLRDLSTRVGEADAMLIKSSLDRALRDVEDPSFDTGTAQSIESIPEGDEAGAESDASADAGSTGALDRTDEDFTREQAKDTGFMGKNSEITWLQRLRQENKYGDITEDLEPNRIPILGAGSTSSIGSKKVIGDYSVPLPEVDSAFTVQESSYHLDDLAISTFEAVEPYEYPTPETAQRLFDIYMTRVHSSLPIVGKMNLTSQFQKFSSGQAQQPPDKWLAIVNMIFAIGAKYSHLIQAEWKGDERDHLIYFTRARMLSVSVDTIFQHPDLQSIQIMGLMSFYFLCINQINRAWTMAGVAIRWATALGMNMRNESYKLKDALKEIRYRVWWALYALEHRLCGMTGRVNCVVDEHCTTPLPAPLEEDKFDTEEGQRLLNTERQQGDRAPSANSHSHSGMSSTASSAERSRSGTKTDKSRSPSAMGQSSDLGWAKNSAPNSSLYFLHLIQLTRLTQNIFQKLYNPSAVSGTWSEIQDVIQQLEEQLDSWYRSIPAVFDFRRNQRDREFYEFRLSLGFFYYGTKIMVNRPCLCRLDRKIPNQSAKSQDFNRRSAMACVDAARDMLQLIPDEPNAVGLIRVGPWWSILHWLVQSTTVLMLEISFRAHHMPEEAEGILEASKKGVRWLHALGEENLSAKRAWVLCNGMLVEAASRIGREVTDMPKKPPGPSSSSSHARSSMSGISAPPAANVDYSIPTSMPTFQSFAHFDQMMHYDQYFPIDQSLNEQTQFQQPSDAEMEFMSQAYHSGEDHHQQHTDSGDGNSQYN